MPRRKAYTGHVDCYRDKIYHGDMLIGSYGIPPVRVEGKVVIRKGKYVMLTKGHNPPACPLNKCVKYLGVYKSYEKKGAAK